MPLELEVHRPELCRVERAGPGPSSPGSSSRAPQSGPRCWSSSPMIGFAIQVARWTPLVTWPIGTVSHGRARPEVAPEVRETCAVPRRDAVDPRAQSRIASTVMWNCPGRARVHAEADRAAPASMPISSQIGPVHSARAARPRRRRGPPGTGVWVVKTLWRAHLARPLPRTSCPAATSSRTRSTSMKAACPSLACQTPGSMPSARSTRTPPTPRIHSCRSRRSGPPPYSLFSSARSSG